MALLTSIIQIGSNKNKYVEKWNEKTERHYKHYLTEKEIKHIEKEEKEGKEKWNEARDLDELCDAMVFSLERGFSTPWYNSGVDSETGAILDTLIKIAQTHEMFTIQGQPGICDDDEKQRAFMGGFIATDILDKFIEKLPDDIAIFIYEYFTDEIEMINVNVEEKDWFSWNENTISLTTLHEDGKKLEDHTNFHIKKFGKQAIEEIKRIPNDETIDVFIGSLDNFEDDLVSYIILIYHPKCKLELAKIVLEALSSN